MISALQRAPGELVTICPCQSFVCGAGSSNSVTVFAFPVLSISWLVARDCRSQRTFLGEHPCFVLEWMCGFWPVAGWWSAFLEWNFLPQSRRAAFCLSGEGSHCWCFLRRRAIGRPGVLVLGSGQALGCPSHLRLSPSRFCIQSSTVQRRM